MGKRLPSCVNLGGFQAHSKTGWFSWVFTHPKNVRHGRFSSGMQKRSKSTGESRVRVVFIIFYDFSWCGSTCEMAKKCLFSLGNLGDFQTHSKTGWFSRVFTHPKKCRARVFFSGGGRLPEPRAAQNSAFVHHSFSPCRAAPENRIKPPLTCDGPSNSRFW